MLNFQCDALSKLYLKSIFYQGKTARQVKQEVRLKNIVLTNQIFRVKQR